MVSDGINKAAYFPASLDIEIFIIDHKIQLKKTPQTKRINLFSKNANIREQNHSMNKILSDFGRLLLIKTYQNCLDSFARILFFAPH